MALDQSFGTSKKKKKKKKNKSKPSPRDGVEDAAYHPKFENPAYPPQVALPQPQNQGPGYDWNAPAGHQSDNSRLAYPPSTNIYA